MPLTGVGHALAEVIYESETRVVARCLGLILAGALILACVALRITPKKIGA